MSPFGNLEKASLGRENVFKTLRSCNYLISSGSKKNVLICSRWMEQHEGTHKSMEQNVCKGSLGPKLRQALVADKEVR